MWQKALNCARKTANWKTIKVLFFNNKDQVAQITIHKPESVSAKWYLENIS